ncbi:MAG: PucR family transcriptional regulator ligand-binding domain-containing protein [Lachnospiraceae bacterium]|nr:PucR family transcriptional regulator ligand-binding domain-containing protein [Lachnospiraceae bacterium]
MAVTVNHLYKNATKLYKMKLIAGKGGLNHLVQWVHIIEDEDVSKFLHGQELVFTTGILLKEKGQLLEFTKKLYASDVSAFLVNLGPNIATVPNEVIQYCNEVELPLFVMPWETPMVDVTRDFCHRIMKHDAKEDNLVTTLKNIIFKIGDVETQIQQMERSGFDRDSTFTFVAIMLEEEKSYHQGEKMDKIARSAEEAGRNIQDTYLSFHHKGALVVVLVDYKKEKIDQFIHDFSSLAAWRLGEDSKKLKLGISQNIQGISKQEENLSKAIAAMFISGKEHKVLYYDALDIYKLLISIKDRNVLKECYQEIIGKLRQYDKENETDLCDFLKVYISCNGSQQVVAKELYIHRNTVNNQLKKIEKITGFNPMDIKTQVKIYLGFCIEKLI